MNSDRYNKLSAHLRERFGGRVEKICVDGGFSCPNRDGTCGVGGCTFCAQPAHTEITPENIRAQVTAALNSPKNDAERFIVYFQNYSNTYAHVSELSAKYTAALCDERIAALAVATRPDCITPDIADLLASYADSRYVYVEMGLQTSNDVTAVRINRGYQTIEFTRAANLLYGRGIDVVAHVIFGLPGETDEDMLRTVDYLCTQKITGIKIHSLYVTIGTQLHADYLAGEYDPQTFDQYIRRLKTAITRLRPDIVVHRITGDCERGKLVAPMWNNRKKLIRNALERALGSENLRQGCDCKFDKTT